MPDAKCEYGEDPARSSACTCHAQYLQLFQSLSFWGRAAEAALDQYFEGQPVALYLKFICLIWVCHLYLQMLQEVGSY